MKTFELATKKSKRKNLLKTSLVATGVTLTSLVLLNMGLEQLTSKNAQALRERYDIMQNISLPNIASKLAYFKPTSHYTGFFHVDQAKDIAGITVPYETLELPYALRPIADHRIFPRGHVGNRATALYTYGQGHKIPLFYNTKFDHQIDKRPMTVTQDIALLPQMEGQAVEMAVTFDKPYTLMEIAELVPDTLTINWYWIGSTSSYDISMITPLGFSGGYFPQTYEEVQKELATVNKLSGKALDDYLASRPIPAAVSPEQGLYNSYTHFVGNLKAALNKGMLNDYYSLNEDTYHLGEDAQAYLAANPDGATAKFAGVILTGRAEDFASLENQPWIFGSNIGQHIEIQPYHILSIE